MKLLEERIIRDGRILAGNVLKVDSFLNHQIDVNLINSLSEEWMNLYKNEKITKILTIEASGIGIAAVAALRFGVPLLFAKKSKSTNLDGELYRSQVISYTHGKTYEVIVSKKFLSKDDKVLVIDDFLANGSALNALFDIVNQSGATVVGAGIAIEKAYQGGGNTLREKGYRIESLAKISSMDEKTGIIFE